MRSREGRSCTLERVPIGHDDIAFLQYTGGTTGVAKGAMLLHRNIVANLLQARAWVRPFLGDNGARSIITPLPLYHIFSLTANCLVFMTLGGENVLITEPARHPGLRQGDAQATGSPRSPASTRCSTRCSTTPSSRKLDFSSLRLTLGGGMAVQEAVASSWKEVTGVPLVEAYGLTETSPAATINPLDLPRVQRLDRAADPVDRHRAARRRRQGRAARRAGRDLHQGPAGDGGLLAAPGRDGEGDDRRRLAS